MSMSLKKAIQQKLEPHSERIIQGKNDEFDYLPATLFELIRQQEAASAECNNGINRLSEDAKTTGDLFKQKLDESDQKTIVLISELIQQQEATFNKLKDGISGITHEVKMGNDLVIQKFDESDKKLRRVNYLMLFLLLVITGLLIYIVVKH